MPQVPTSFVPQVGDSGATGSVQFVAPGIAPAENLAAQQQMELGRATQNFGQRVWRVGQIIEDDINTAKAKRQEGVALDAIEGILNGDGGYMYAQGQDAEARFGATESAIAGSVQSAMDGLDNDVQKAMFQQSISRAMTNARSRMVGHRNDQIRQWQVKESGARSQRFTGQAVNAYRSRNDKTVDRNGNPVGEYETNVRVALDEARKVGRILGYQDESEAMAGLERNVMDGVAGGVVGRLMQDSDYGGGIRYLEGLQGKVTPETYEKLMGALVTNRKRQMVDELGESIVNGRGLSTQAGTSPFVNIVDNPTSTYPIKPGIGLAESDVKGGVLITAPGGSLVRAPYDGVIVAVGGERDTQLAIRLENGDLARIGGMSWSSKDVIALYEGRTVSRGQEIGVIGSNPITFSLERDGKDLPISQVNMLNPGEQPPRAPSTEQEALAEANGIKDREVRDDVRKWIRGHYKEKADADAASYAALQTEVSKIVARDGDVSNVPPMMWASLTEKDRESFSAQFAQFNDITAMEQVAKHPGLLTFEWLAQNKGMFTRGTYESLVSQVGSGMNKNMQVDASLVTATLVRNKMMTLANPKSQEEKNAALLLREEINRQLAKERAKGTLDDKAVQGVVDRVITTFGGVTIDGWIFDTVKVPEMPTAAMTPDQQRMLITAEGENIKKTNVRRIIDANGNPRDVPLDDVATYERAMGRPLSNAELLFILNREDESRRSKQGAAQ